MIPYSKAKYFSEKIIFNKLFGIKHWSILGSKGMTPVTGFQMTEEKIIHIYIYKVWKIKQVWRLSESG